MAKSNDGWSKTGGTMSGIIRIGDQSKGSKSNCRSSNTDQNADSQKQHKSKSGPEFHDLTRCAACYNHKAHNMRWHDGNSSTSDEDSGPEVDRESEAESDSSSSSSEHAVAATPEISETERHSPVCGDAAKPECGTDEGEGRDGMGNTPESRRDLIPLSLLSPPRIVSTLHLQVLSEKHDDDVIFTIRPRLSEGMDENAEERNKVVGINSWLSPQPSQWQQTGLPWQQQSQTTSQHHQYQQQQQMLLQYQLQPPQHFPPLSAQGQMFTTPPHPPSVSPCLTPIQGALRTHPHALSPHLCWHCYRIHSPYTYCRYFSRRRLHR